MVEYKDIANTRVMGEKSGRTFNVGETSNSARYMCSRTVYGGSSGWDGSIVTGGTSGWVGSIVTEGTSGLVGSSDTGGTSGYVDSNVTEGTSGWVDKTVPMPGFGGRRLGRHSMWGRQFMVGCVVLLVWKKVHC